MSGTSGESGQRLRILMLMRNSAFSKRGGDTVLLEKWTEQLRAFGHEVVWDFDQKENWSSFDLAHLINFATPEVTEEYARRAVRFKIPFLVTTLYEDWPEFFSPMVEAFFTVEKYVDAGQTDWNAAVRNTPKLPPMPIQDNSFAAFHAEALVASGEEELRILKRDYPHSKAFYTTRFGCEVVNRDADPELFRKTYGIDNFVLCVGRLEWRKNQLSLLRALEDQEMPIVFVAGGFTYQPEYEAVCRKFRRPGKTHILSRLEPEMLASAFAAARVHALPSWYELPGLVSVEAAHYGTNVVASDRGTIRDYLGDDAFYCNPSSIESIRAAVLQAWNAPRSTRLKERVRKLTWENSTRELIQVYEKVLKKTIYIEGRPSMKQSDFADLPRLDAAMKTIVGASSEVSKAKETVSLIPVKLGVDVGDPSQEVEALCQEGDQLARDGKNADAAKKFEEALRISRDVARPYRGLAVLALNEKRFIESETLFQRALTVDPDDVKSELGLALVQSQSGAKREAIASYEKVLLKHPGNLLGVRQYLQLCYEMEHYAGLEKVLRAYLTTDWKNVDMKFCLAGCLYKGGKLEESRALVEEILEEHPQHEASLELKKQLDKAAPPAPQKSTPMQMSAVEEGTAKQIRNLEELVRAKKFNDVEAESDMLLETALEDHERILVEIIRAEALICLGRGKEAKRVFESHRDDVTYGYRATSSLGVYWGSENDWEKAKQLFRVAVALKPTHDVALAGLGVCALLAGEREEAWEFFSRAHASNPENLRALTGMIEVAYPLKRLDALEQALLNYLDFVPANLSILYAHAGCAYALGKKDVALKQLEKIRLLDPQHALANELFDKIHEEEGQFSQANA